MHHSFIHMPFLNIFKIHMKPTRTFLRTSKNYILSNVPCSLLWTSDLSLTHSLKYHVQCATLLGLILEFWKILTLAQAIVMLALANTTNQCHKKQAHQSKQLNLPEMPLNTSDSFHLSLSPVHINHSTTASSERVHLKSWWMATSSRFTLLCQSH